MSTEKVGIPNGEEPLAWCIGEPYESFEVKFPFCEFCKVEGHWLEDCREFTKSLFESSKAILREDLKENVQNRTWDLHQHSRHFRQVIHSQTDSHCAHCLSAFHRTEDCNQKSPSIIPFDIPLISEIQRPEYLSKEIKKKENLLKETKDPSGGCNFCRHGFPYSREDCPFCNPINKIKPKP